MTNLNSSFRNEANVLNSQQHFPEKVSPSLLRVLWNMWAVFSGPAAHAFEQNIQSQERLRRSRLLSALLLGAIVLYLVDLPDILAIPAVRWGILINICCASIALVLNRLRLITPAALLFIFGIDADLVYLFLSATSAIGVLTIHNFDLFLLTTLVASLILDRRMLPFIGLAQVLLILGIFTFSHHDATITRGYAHLELPLQLQIGGTIIAWLGAWSIDRALLRASRAEELARVLEHLNMQTQKLHEQKQRLDYGIALLKAVQARVANGDYTARVVLQDNELLPVAISFNLMVERLGQAMSSGRDSSRLHHGLQLLLDSCARLEARNGPLPVQRTGTELDRVFAALERLGSLHIVLNRVLSLWTRYCSSCKRCKSRASRSGY